MSPAVNVDLEEVPFAILELVKARILANRRRLLPGQQGKPRPSTRPGAQFRKVGASSKEWRKPQYGAGVFEQPGKTGLAWISADDTGSGFNSTFLWRHSLTQEKLITDDDKYRFKVGCGDGSKWIDAEATLAGIAAYRNLRETYFTPVATDQIRIGSLVTLLFRSDPTGKFIRYESRSASVDDSASPFFALPCGNGSCILITHFRAAGSIGATVSRATNAIRYETEALGVYWEVFPGFIEQVNLKRHNISAADVLAFVVSQTDCRQISVPAALRSALDAVLPDANWGGAPSGITEGLTPDFLSYNAASSEYWAEQNGLYFRKFDALTGQRELMSFGMSSDVMEMVAPFHQVLPSSYSPSIFPLLTQHPSLLPALSTYYDIDYNNDPSYAEAGDLLRSFGVPAPRDIVGFDARDQAYLNFSTAVYEDAPGYDFNASSGKYVYLDPDRLLPYIRVVRANAQPDQPLGQLPQSLAWSQVARLPLASSRTLPYTGQYANYGLIWHYDWGNPSYCRQQLLALGFTESDLTP